MTEWFGCVLFSSSSLFLSTLGSVSLDLHDFVLFFFIFSPNFDSFKWSVDPTLEISGNFTINQLIIHINKNRTRKSTSRNFICRDFTLVLLV